MKDGPNKIQINLKFRNNLKHEVIKQQINKTRENTNHEKLDKLFLKRWKCANSITDGHF
jgi:transcriptional regulator of met regulon